MTPEIEVIGQILVKPSLLADCSLTALDFVSEQHQEIYGTILAMSAANTAIDPISVSDELQRKTYRDWLPVVGEIANKANFYNFSQQVKHVKENGKLINSRRILNNALIALENKDTSGIDVCIRDLMALESTSKKHLHSMDDCLSAAIDKIEKTMESDGLLGVTTGLTALDESLGGFHDTDFIVIGARPAMGKTAFMLNCALSAARSGPVLVFSGEQGMEQVGQRTLSIVGGVSSQKIRTANFGDDWHQLTSSMVLARKLPMEVYDESAPSINTIIRVSRQVKYQRNIRAIYVDYIQRVESSGKYQNKRDAVGEIAKSLKTLAKELQIPVIALAQVNREVEKRPDKRPTMSDLSDSSEIEKEADVVMTLYRDEVYDKESPEKGIAEVLIAKNRHGPTGQIKAIWRSEFMQFKDMASYSGADF